MIKILLFFGLLAVICLAVTFILNLFGASPFVSTLVFLGVGFIIGSNL